MESLDLQVTCCAVLKSKGTRCTARVKSGGLCGRHLKCKNVVMINDLTNCVTNSCLINNKEITKKNPNKKNNIISIYQRSRLRYNTVTLKELYKTLKFHNLPLDGKKRDLFERLLSYFDSLKPYINQLDKIGRIQIWFRKCLDLKIDYLKEDFTFPIEKFVNDTDFFSLEKLSELEHTRLISYQDNKGFVYGFDILSFRQLIEMSNENPYTGKEIDEQVIKKAKKYLNLLMIKGFKMSSDSDDEKELNPKYAVKRRVVKYFQEMDKLDQYTNPAWFLDLSTVSLIKFYKEAEDIWNYRLNLTKETKIKIVPPNGKVFLVEPKNVAKDYTTKDSLRNLCLDVIEKLIYSAQDRSDRVNGCIYILLALVIVNPQAAEAMPAYYTMVTGDVTNANFMDIPV